MATTSTLVLQHLRRLSSGPLTPAEDATLLGRFVCNRDEGAFAALLRRHGPMVLGVCRRALADAGEAEDAFQAVFLVLARRAAVVRPAEGLANWLYGVARRVTLKARSTRARRREAPAADLAPPDPHPDPLTELTDREALAVLEDEVERLPEGYRLPVVLCCLEGLSQEEAAQRLGCTPGSVKGRLERGRRRLQERLASRGLALVVALAAVDNVRSATPAGMHGSLLTSAASAARRFAGGQAMSPGKTSAHAVVLAEGVLKAMRLTGLRNLGIVALLAAIVGTVALLAFAAPADRQDAALPIYVHPELLREAEKSGVALTTSWNTNPERFHGQALRDLRDCLQRLSGGRHMLTAHDPKAEKGIFAGTFALFPAFKPRHAAARTAIASTDPEAFVVEVQGDRLYILGKSRAGLIAAVYTFLDRLGYKWFAPGKAWEQLPVLKGGLKLDAKLNVASAGPSYRGRRFFPSYGPNTSVFRKGMREEEYALWFLRNRLGGSAATANYQNDPAMVPPALFKKRPELFALVKGKRNPYALSRANPDTVALAVKSAVRYLKDHEGKGAYFNSFSVETNDGAPACEWSLMKLARDRAGKPTATDLNYWFANRVAAGIEEAGLKGKWVGMCSYGDHAGVPSFDLHPRVAVVVTTGLDFSSGGLTVEQRLDGLRKRKCQRLGVYHYLNLITWSLDKPGCSPVSNPLRLAADLKRWYDHGSRTYVAETSDSWVSGGAGHYLAARLLWNIKADPRKELDAYYKGAFGPAAAEVRALCEDWDKLPLKVKMPPGALPAMPKITRGRAARWYHWITRAERRVKGRPVYLVRLNALKRYYLYLNFWREYELDLVAPGMPSKQDRYLRLLRYVGSNRGEGAFHALGLFPTLAANATAERLDTTRWPKEFQAISRNIADDAAWRVFPVLTNVRIDKRFKAAELPLAGHARTTLDPRLKLFPAGAKAPAVLKFPKLHGPPAVPRQYVLRVVAPVPRLTFQVVTGSPHGAGMPERTWMVTDAGDNEVKKGTFKADRPARFDLTDLKPGVYTATFPEFGAEQLTVSGGNTIGAVRASADAWGFNPMRRSDQKAEAEVTAYFVVPPGQSSLRVRLSEGKVSLGFHGGGVIAAEIEGAAKKAPQEFKFAPSKKPRVAYLRWGGKQIGTRGLVIEGMTLFSPDPSAVLHEILD